MSSDEAPESSSAFNGEFDCEFEHCDEQAFIREAREADGSDAEASPEPASPEEAPREETPHWVSMRAATAEAQRAARKLRQREAYQRAKERRANDPRLQQLKLQQKEAAKARRREHYDRVKQHRKAAKAAGKAVRSAERASTESAGRAFFANGRVRPSKAALLRETRELAPAAFVDVVAANDIR
jgi:hypothetical protein